LALPSPWPSQRLPRLTDCLSSANIRT
jgi:hypothetical protein